MNQSATETYQPRTGNQSDFISDLYHRYGKKLLSYAVHTWKVDEDKAWDIIYKTLYKVVDTYSKYTFENEQKFGGFIFRIFINLMRNHYRDTKEHPMNITSDLTSVEHKVIEDESDEQIASQKMQLLKMELDKMEDWQRILLLMRSDGRPYSEIAKYVNKPEDQLKVYYQRLKKNITDKLNEQL